MLDITDTTTVPAHLIDKVAQEWLRYGPSFEDRLSVPFAIHHPVSGETEVEWGEVVFSGVQFAMAEAYHMHRSQWTTIGVVAFSRSGRWAAYEISREQADGARRAIAARATGITHTSNTFSGRIERFTNIRGGF